MTSLSDLCRTVEQRRRDRLAAQGGGLPGAILRYLSRQSLGDSLRFALSIPLWGMLASFAAVVLGAPGPEERGDQGLLSSLGEIHASLAGLLFAVIVFAVEFEAERSGTLAPLTRFIHKQRGLLGHAAFVAGVVAAAAVLAILSNHGAPLNPMVATYYVLILFLLSLGSVLYNLHSVVFPAPSSVLARIRQHLLVEVQEYVDDALTSKDYFETYMATLGELGLAFQPIGFPNGREVKLSIGRQGVITNVVVEGLVRLRLTLRELDDAWEYVVGTCPGMDAQWTALALRPKARKDRAFHGAPADLINVRVMGAPDVQDLPEEYRARLQRLIASTFIVEDVPADTFEFGNTMALLVESIERDVACKDGNACSAKLDILEGLVFRWASEVGSISGLLSIGEYTPRLFPRTLEGALYGVVQKANASGDHEVIETLEKFLLAGTRTGFSSENEELLRSFVRLVYWHYREHIKHSKKKASASHFDRFTSAFLSIFQTNKIEEEDNRGRLLLIVIGGYMRMLRDAVEHGRTADFKRMYTQLFDGSWSPQLGQRDLAPRPLDRDSAVGVDPASLLQVVSIVLTAWCSRRARQDADGTAKIASTVVTLCSEHVPNSHSLAWAWELAMRDRLPERMGVNSWDSELLEIRPGFSSGGLIDIDWYKSGLVFLAILQSPPLTDVEELPLVDRESPDAWDPTWIRTRLEALPELSLEVPAEELAERKERFLGHIDACQMVRRRATLEAMMETPIDGSRIEEILSAVEEKEEANQGLVQMLEHLGLGDHARSAPYKARARWHLPKQKFVKGGEKLGGTEGVIADGITLQSDVQSCGTAEQLARRSTTSANTENVRRLVILEIGRQRDNGLDPNLVLIPQGYEWKRGLLGDDYWVHKQGPTLGSRHVGRIEGCEVIEWPHDNPSSVMVANSAMVFARLASVNRRRIGISVSDMSDVKQVDVRERLDKAKGSSELPDDRDVFVVCDVDCVTRLGFVHPESAMCIPIAVDANT